MGGSDGPRPSLAYRVRGAVRLRTRIRKYLATHRSPQDIVDAFHRLYYDREDTTWQQTYWLGVRVLKLPLDLWTYQEIVYEVRPDLIIETGTAHGGSALFLASVCDLIDHGKVVSIDIVDRPGLPQHPRIHYLVGSSTDTGIVRTVADLLGNGRGLVILDSDHARDHVLRELELYSGFVAPGSYLIVEDTDVNGHPVHPTHGPGPTEALEIFLPKDHRFEVDRGREQKFLLTFHPGGYLRRVPGN